MLYKSLRAIVSAAAVIACCSALPSIAQTSSPHHLDTVPLNRIVVKFKDDMGIKQDKSGLHAPVNTSISQGIGGLSDELNSVERVMRDNQLSLSPVFSGISSTAGRIAQTPTANGLGAPTTRQHADLSSYFYMKLDPSWTWSKAEPIVKELIQLGHVENAYIEPVPQVAALAPADAVAAPGASTSTTPDFENQQGYLDPAPMGIDARYAWTVAGGRGAGVNIVDIEFGFDRSHEDLPDFFVDINNGNDQFRDHGTAVLGVVGAIDNGFGVTGITSDANLGFASHTPIGVAEAIRQAADAAGAGGVIIIEVHYRSSVTVECTCNFGQCGFIPAEFLQADYDAIRYAISKGVVVIEAAGNGSVNLDDPTYISRYNLQGRADSGAIMVGGSFSDRRDPMCWSNHGSYVDIHGWGQNVATTGYSGLFNGGTSPEGFSRNYTSSFSGTSSASPVVAGAAASLQGIALAATGNFLTPAQVEDILVNTGSPQTHTLNKNIGPLPNLRSAIRSYQGTPPETDFPSMFVRSTASNWEPVAMQAAYDNVWELVVRFGDDEDPRFVFDVLGNESQQYGDNEGDTLAELSGDDIRVQGQRQYRITFHETTKRYNVELYGASIHDRLRLDWTSFTHSDIQFVLIDDHTWETEFKVPSGDTRFTVKMEIGDVRTSYYDGDNDGILDNATAVNQVFTGLQSGKTYRLTVNEQTLAYTLEQIEAPWERTIVFVFGETVDGQDMFVRGGIDHNHASSALGRNCTAENLECAIPIRHRNVLNATTAPWKQGDEHLDWYGLEPAQNGGEGSPLDWTINQWPADWGAIRRLDVDGFGETSLNRWGAHYWIMDVDMDCEATANGWFELKTFISNGPGWENDVSQPGAPWASGNHFAQCGKLNVFRRGESQPVTIEAL